MSTKTNLPLLIVILGISTFALSACMPLREALRRLQGLWAPDDTPTTCDVEAFIVTEDLDIYDGECNSSCSLREAIQWANECDGPDSVIIPPMEHQMLLTGVENGDITITDDVLIAGNGIGNSIIFGPLFWNDRLFTIEEGVHAEIRDLTIKGGNAFGENGGAILNLGDLVLENVKLESNQAERGGGLYNAGSATLENVQIVDNIAKVTPDYIGETFILYGVPTDDCGGGITNAGSMSIISGHIYSNEALIGSGICNAPGGELTITSSWIQDNLLLIPDSSITTIAGGGISNFSNLIVEDSQITGNKAHIGGGIFMFMPREAEMHLTNVLIDSNQAVLGRSLGDDSASGGGLYLSQGNFWITGSEITSNVAAQKGGGMTNSSPSSGMGSISNSLFANNQARNYGGAVYNTSSSLRITNVTIGKNSSNRGAGLDISGGSVSLMNVTVAYNEGRSSAAINVTRGNANIYNSIIAYNDGVNPCWHETSGNIQSGGFNIEDGHSCLNPTTASPTELHGGDIVDATNINLGRTLTGLPGETTRYYSISPGSAAIDKIDPSLCPPDDQRGVLRPIPDGGLCDMGAYEAPLIAPISGQVDPSDIMTVTPFPPTEPASPSVPAFTFTTNANCREGPGTQYEVDDSFLQGHSAQIDGRNQSDPIWWWVLRSNGGHCWVSDTTGTASGPTGNVQVVAAPPPPVVNVPTDTPTSPPPPLPQTSPSAPSKLYVQDHVCAGSTYAVTLAWGDTSDNETGFRIYRDNNLIVSLGANATSYTDSPPTGGPYYYVVEAYNDAGATPSTSVKDDGCIF